MKQEKTMKKEKEEVEKRFQEFLKNQEKETAFDFAIIDAFTRINGDWHEDYYEMVDFLCELKGLPHKYYE
jgi:hypothetical protein